MKLRDITEGADISWSILGRVKVARFTAEQRLYYITFTPTSDEHTFTTPTTVYTIEFDTFRGQDGKPLEATTFNRFKTRLAGPLYQGDEHQRFERHGQTRRPRDIIGTVATAVTQFLSKYKPVAVTWQPISGGLDRIYYLLARNANLNYEFVSGSILVRKDWLDKTSAKPTVKPQRHDFSNLDSLTRAAL